MKTRETIKNVMLCVLFLIMIELIYSTLVWGVWKAQGRDLPDSLVALAIEKLNGKSEIQHTSVEAKTAVYPRSVALGDGANLYITAFDEETIKKTYSDLSPLFAAALESARDLKTESDEDYEKSLSKKVVYLSYENAVPFMALAAWLGVEDAAIWGSAESIILSEYQGGIKMYFRSKTPGEAFSYMTDIKPQDLSASIGNFKGNGKFAALSGDGFEHLSPDTLIYTEAPRINKLKRAKLKFEEGSEEQKIILETFGYNPYITKSYTTSMGTNVFVSNESTVSIKNDTQVEYRAGADSAGIKVAGLSPLEERTETEIKVIEAVRDITDRASKLIGGDGDFFFRDIMYDPDKDMYTVRFGRRVDGISVMLENEEAFAVFEIQNSSIVYAKIMLYRYEKIETAGYLMPQKQAAAAAKKSSPMFIRYFDENSGEIYPVWYAKV